VKQQYSWKIFSARSAIKYSPIINLHGLVDGFGVANVGKLIHQHALSFLLMMGCSNQGAGKAD
jgi:hypothetical protein